MYSFRQISTSGQQITSTFGNPSTIPKQSNVFRFEAFPILGTYENLTTDNKVFGTSTSDTKVKTNMSMLTCNLCGNKLSSVFDTTDKNASLPTNSVNGIRRDPLFPENLTKKLCEVQKSGEYCDYELKTEDGGSFKVHKLVLSSSSPFFQKLFTSSSEFCTSDSDSLLLVRVSSNALEKIIQFMYTGEIKMNEVEIAKEIFDTSLFLCIFTLVEMCIQFLIEHINDKNCLDLLKYSEKCLHYGEKLTKECLKLHCKNFDSFVNLPEYLELSIETIEILVAQKKSTYTDEDLYIAIRKWIIFDLENRKEFTTKLLDGLQLENISSEFAKLNIFDNNPLLNMKEFNDKLITILCNNWSQVENSLNHHRRLYGIFNDNVLLYEHSTNEFCKTITKLSDNRQSFGYSTFGKKNIFICGGKIDGNVVDTCSYFSTRESKWYDMPSMKEARKCAKLITLDDKIYVCAGLKAHSTFVNSVEIFNIKNLVWSEGSSLINVQNKCPFFDVCYSNNSIYFVSRDGIQRLDPRQSGWINLHVENFNEDINSVETYENLIYGFSSKSISTFDIRLNKWLVNKVPYKQEYLSSPKTCVVDDEIYIFDAIGFEYKNFYLQSHKVSDLSFSRCLALQRNTGAICHGIISI